MSRLGKAAVVVGALGATASLAVLASCATTDAGPVGGEDSSIGLPDATTPDGGDAALNDGGCDPSDPECVTTPISCAEAAWCPVPTNVVNLYALTAVWGSSKTDVWAAGSGGTVLHWDGAAWKPTPVPSPTNLPIKNTFHGLWGSGPNDVWLASATNVVFHTDGFKNGTAEWTRLPNATESDFNSGPIYAAWGAAGEVRFGSRSFTLFQPNGDMGDGNQVVATKAADGGVVWGGVTGSATINGIWGASADDVWLLGDNSRNNPWQVGLTMHGSRRGNALVWTEIDSRASAVLRGVWGSSATDVWAVGDNGTIRRFTGVPAAGSEWTIIASPSQAALQAVWGSGPNDVWAVGTSGTILHWDGATWNTSVAAYPVNRKRPDLYAVWGSGPDDVWIVGDGITLHHTGGVK
jgi:hypothetical protein